MGSHLENMLDRDAKGRNVNLTGQRHGMSKLSDQDVRDIQGCDDDALALSERYGVARKTIYYWRQRATS